MSQVVSALSRYPEYEVTIGIEVHVQLSTTTKIFCSCANRVGQEPNTNICMICTGHPGVLPVLNKKVLEYALLAGCATNSQIARKSSFSRKHYFYPDLPKNYQITQGNDPICSQGYIPIRLEDDSEKRIRLIRIHMEEDAGKNIHAADSNESFVDLNRTGTPLLEIVSYPDIASSYEARTYLKALRLLVQSLGICSGNMESGAFRADTNISVRKKGASTLGTRCELKNINSFKFISDAIEYEIERQIELLESGEKVRQETRLWDTKDHKTVVMRSKEEAADYRYVTDPDLPLLELTEQEIERVKQSLPELPYNRFNRLMTDYGLSSSEAEILIDDSLLADYFESAYSHSPYKSLINWVVRDVMGYLKENKLTLVQFLVTPEKIGQLMHLLENRVINHHAAKQVFELCAQTGESPKDGVKRLGLEQIDSKDELEKIVLEVVNANPAVVQEYKSGKEKLFGFFVGQVMQKTKGKGNPALIQELLKKHLS